MKQNKYLYLSSIFISILAVLFLLNPSMLLINSDDQTYHVMVAQEFARANGLVLWTMTESLPDGRAQIYPPVYHLFLSALVKLPVKPINLMIAAGFIATIGLLTLSWYSMRKLFNERTAFIYLLFLTMKASVISMFSITTPASIVLITAPIIILLIQKNKKLAALLLMIVIWHTHTVFTYLAAASLLLWAVFNRQYLSNMSKVLVGSYIFYLPWLIHILINKRALRYTHSDWPESFKMAITANVNLTSAILFIFAIIFILIWRKKNYNKNLWFFVGLIIFSSPLAYIAPLRFFSSTGILGILAFIAYFFDQIIEIKIKDKKNHTIKQISIFILIAIAVSAHYNLILNNVYKKKPFLITGFSLIQNFYHLQKHGEPYPLANTDFNFTDANLLLAKSIQRSSNPNDPILNISPVLGVIAYSDHIQFHIAQFFSAITNRPMINARYPDNLWKETLDVDQAAIVLADYKQTHLFNDKEKNEAEQFLADYLDQNFETIGVNGRLIALKNKNQNTFESRPAKPVMPLWLAWILMASILSYASYNLKKEDTLSK